jgi:hypothetical protein
MKISLTRIGHLIGLAIFGASVVTAVAPAPVEPVAPAPIATVAPEATATPVAPEPEPCPEATAEDGSCVPFTFYAPTYTLEPCEEEDGSGQVACYWDASERENGLGRDFIVLNGVTFYPEG